MAKYMLQGSYTAEGARGLLKDGGSGRRAAVERACASVGGKLETFYFSFGADDFVVIVDAPDNEAAAAVALGVAATGAVTLRTTVLLTIEQADAVAKRVVDYRAPGA